MDNVVILITSVFNENHNHYYSETFFRKMILTRQLHLNILLFNTIGIN